MSTATALAPSVLAPPAAIAAPEPDPIPRRWELRVEPSDLRLTSVDVPGVGPRAFFYLTYTVTNSSGEDRDFHPAFELTNESGRVYRSGRGVAPEVVDELLRRIDNPFLLDEIRIQGRLLQGEEHAKEGLVVWPAEDLQAGDVAVFAMGFSGETKAVKRPDNGQEVILRKTLMLQHDLLGEADPSDNRPLPRTGVRWILR